MKNPNNKTAVVFRKFKEGDIIALFPYEIDSGTCIMSYQHMGQHSGADYDSVIKCTKQAKQKEYRDLYTELVGIGYDLEIIKRQNRRKYLAAKKELIKDLHTIN